MKILIIYYYKHGFPMRKTNEDMLFCFKNFSNNHCIYVNAAFSISEKLLSLEFDLIIYHDLLLCKRSFISRFIKIKKATKKLENLKGYKIALIQDEFLNTKILNEYLIDHKIQHIFSTANESEWSKIYPKLFKKVKISNFLTGYINEDSINQIIELYSESNNKTIDIGYRASYDKRYSLGKHGLLKGIIADKFTSHKDNNILMIDVSSNKSDSFNGIDWYKFLLKSKYTLGVESGASILDEDGEIERKVLSYLEKHPDATFDETEEACFKGIDGNLELFAIGPRHFEAIMTKTCQILVEGHYNGILIPWRHYIPLKKDFSNMEEVLEIVKKDEIRHEIVENAYNDIVLSGKYSYKSFVDNVITESLGLNYQAIPISKNDKKLYIQFEKREKFNWFLVKFNSFIIDIILKIISKGLINKLNLYFKRA